MPQVRNFLRYWLPPGLWMLLIFGASADTHSAEHSSRILEPLLRWLLPGLSADQLGLAVLLARKLAHGIEYAVLALLLWRALRKPAAADPRPWDWSMAGRTLLFVALYAASDEWHQHLVPTRQGAVSDVLLDILGGLAGLFVAWLIVRWQQRRASSPGKLSLT
ncbi:MAG TPA: VanZ family protein [Verrucomicrobiota bacterium]|jgi:VanZ family protein|nr:MAG: VanZ like family protein [Verrucomicrobia bacterium ADurb.Bin118]HPY31385.1 VanZ family protein [Verrucomicrobiota bacterium]HQB16942.1 VanZ family protein [Verrucomicrobiota bacterium]